ncbi:MAG: LamG domain-containing protein [Planctomycetota bacterium]
MCKKLIPFYTLLLITMPVYAVETYKISDYGGGHQIWFEAEDYDERNPDTDQYYPVVDAAGAFGQAITRAGGAGGMIRWTFNIGAAGGKGGTWYFWGRVINPSNQSDFMLVEGHPGEPQIPTGPPFPGTSSAPGFTNEHRVFEENMGPPWEWGRSGHGEAHTKQLQDGENTMYILHRQGNDTVFWDVFMWTDDAGYVPTDEDYQNAFPGLGFGPAARPDPADGALLLDTWVNLNWRPGDFAVSHDVYFSDNFDDVNAGAEGVFQGNQAGTFLIIGFPGFAYPDGLVPGATYYWRIDEVNDTDPNSPWKGDVWSFTIPPRTAYAPNPADGVKFVDPDVELSWTAGFRAKLHYVHFGDNFDDVNSAVVGLPQGTTSYTPGTLELEKTYYWRIDEFDGVATHKGDVWSFSTIPDIAITDTSLVGWWKLDEDMGTTAVDWSGHGNHGTLQGDPQWVAGYDGDALEFDGSGDWVTTDIMPADVGVDGSKPKTVTAWVYTRGFNNGGIYDMGSQSDGQEFCLRTTTTVNEWRVQRWGYPTYDFDFTYPTQNRWVHFAQVYSENLTTLYANGVSIGTQTVELNTANAAFVIGRYGSSTGFNGIIDNVRLYNKALTVEEILLAMRGDPLLAWGPKPSHGSTLYIRDATPLSWSAGDNASQHDIYFGTDRDAVVDADESDTTGIYRGRQGVTIYTPAEGVEWGGGPYYWRVDEYNTDATISKGNVWSFTVADSIVIEDFEDYNDYPPDEIFSTWIDGYGTTTNGSTAGYAEPDFLAGEHYVETSVVHGGGQSMPLFYDNNFKYSEAAMTLTQRDWTEEGVGVLSLWFRGDASNAAERMYVALNGSAVVYHINPNAAQIATWTEWPIDLQGFADQGVNLANVNTIALGFGDKTNPQAGGSGTMYIDDIRLYRPAP